MCSVLFLGVDPGANGAMFAVGDNYADHINFAKASDTSILHWLLAQKLSCETLICGMEQVAARRNDDVVTAFTFGGEVRRIKTILNIADIPYEQVLPIRWMNYMARGRYPSGRANYDARKRALLGVAKEILPYKKLTLSNADAFLIAKYMELTKTPLI